MKNSFMKGTANETGTCQQYNGYNNGASTGGRGMEGSFDHTLRVSCKKKKKKMERSTHSAVATLHRKILTRRQYIEDADAYTSIMAHSTAMREYSLY